MGRRQVVRHWVLVPAFAGSNPAGPAKFVHNYYPYQKYDRDGRIFCLLLKEGFWHFFASFE